MKNTAALLFPFLIIVLGIVILMPGCKSSQAVSGTTLPAGDTIADHAFRKVIRDRQLYGSVTEVVPLDTVYILKDTLHVHTHKISGCDAEDFKLLWSGMFTKSLPPQTSIKLFQQVTPTCSELHYFHLRFNLSSIHLRQSSDTLDFAPVPKQKHTMLLRIGGWKEMIKWEN